jgi:glutamyl-Q tRNA(Asp) synthetase
MPQMIGRFAPSPTGPLHLGSLVAAMASWLDVRAHGGRWIVRLEDIDQPRTVPGADAQIIAALESHGFRWDGPIVRQSERLALYRQAFDRLRAQDAVYPCACSRRELDDSAAVYPGTCRDGLRARPPRAWRMRVPSGIFAFEDRAAGLVQSDLEREVGDFVVRRADGFWAYQLAVVVDDGAQGVTDVIRGADLLDSTPRQRLLQEALGLPRPRTLHVPLLLDASGRKLAKSSGAAPLDPANPLPALRAAAHALTLDVAATTNVGAFWEAATRAWASRWAHTRP